MTAILQARNIFVAIDGKAILPDLSMTVPPGQFVGLVGPNGAGKSTLLKACAGTLQTEAGAIELGGEALRDLTFAERARRLAYLPQARPLFWSMPVREIVALGRFAFGAGTLDDAGAIAVARAMEETGISVLGDRPVTTLSGGELARVHLARALSAEAPLLLADEPIAALDPAHQLAVMALLQKHAEQGGAVIAALHDLELAARFCTRMIVLHHGNIAADGAPRDVLTADLMRKVFNVFAKIDHTGDQLNFVLSPLGP